MKLLLKMLFLSLVAVLLTYMVMQDPGYVLLARKPWVIEISLVLFVILLMLSFVILYFVVRFVKGTWDIRANLRHWHERRRRQRAQRALTKGLMFLSQKRWKEAETQLIKFAADSDAPLLNYLGAAKAAQEQESDSRRDSYLSQAHSAMPDADVAVGITQADLQLRHGQYEQALASLKHLRKIAPRHNHVLKLLMLLYEQLHDWPSLHRLLPELRKNNVVSDDAYQALQQKVLSSLLQHAPDSNALQSTWQTVPRSMREQTTLVRHYVSKLIEFDEHDAAMQVLQKHMKRAWSDTLVDLLADIQTGDANRQLLLAESWLKQHPVHADCLLVAGQLAMRAALWGKAQSYIENAIEAGAGARAYQLLARLLEQHGDPQQAAEIYRQGLDAALAMQR